MLWVSFIQGNIEFIELFIDYIECGGGKRKTEKIYDSFLRQGENICYERWNVNKLIDFQTFMNDSIERMIVDD